VRLAIALVLVAGLAACATPRQRCLAAAGGDLRVVDRLIAQTERDLARGYGIVEETYLASSVGVCLGTGVTSVGSFGGGVGVTIGTGTTLCDRVETRSRARPVALDTAAERRKLADLRATRARLSAEADARAAACPAV